MTLRTYKTPEGFRTALEQRIHKRAEDLKRTFERERTLLVFDRLLGRIGQEFGDSATQKGGFALERRLARARTTKDVDLRMVGSPANVLQRLQAAGRLDLGARPRRVHHSAAPGPRADHRAAWARRVDHRARAAVRPDDRRDARAVSLRARERRQQGEREGDGGEESRSMHREASFLETDCREVYATLGLGGAEGRRTSA